MRRYIFVFTLIIVQHKAFSQVDFSQSWEDFYSYNNVSDFYQSNTKIIALSDNALFIYDKTTHNTEKLSSVHGLSGETTSAIYYSETLEKIVIGYESGLIEIVDAQKKVYVKPDIVNFNILGSKAINHITAHANDLYLSTSFGVVVFDLNTLNFKNTYFIGNGSSEVFVNEIAIFNNLIYAATKQGLYIATLTNPFLIDYQHWTLYFNSLDITNIAIFDNQVYMSIWNNLHHINPDFSSTPILSVSENVLDLKSNETHLTLSTNHSIKVYDTNLSVVQQVASNPSDLFYFSANSAQTFQNELFIATKEYGILKSSFANVAQFNEIHPEGPISNNPFSISVLNNNLWVVYGGHDDSVYAPAGRQKGVSHFNGTHWVNLPFKPDGVNYRDLVHVNIDPTHPNKVFVSSWGDGMLIIENDEVTTRWNHLNSALENLYTTGSNVSVRVGSSVFDKNGNLWVAWLYDKLYKYDTSGQWSTINLGSVVYNYSYGLNEVIIDKTGNKWIGTADNGALVVNESGTKIMSLIETVNKGSLPSLNVRCMAVDKDNKIWIGTRKGMRVFASSAGIFDQTTYDAKPIVLAYGQDDENGEALLGNQNINSICVDGADNKWFGTDGAGVLTTDSKGKKTIYQFNTLNSPLPSNKIMQIRFDPTTGNIFFATDKGILVYKSNISPYGDSLQEVYAYPNPVINTHETVTIDGRNGTHIPYGTNVKIMDAAGKLVYETNVEEGQEEFGGKVTWNKTNLAGHKVASGVYIVLLYYPKESQVSSTKIAIIN